MFILARITKNTFLSTKNSYTMPNMMYQPLGTNFQGFDQKWSSFCPGKPLKGLVKEVGCGKGLVHRAENNNRAPTVPDCQMLTWARTKVYANMRQHKTCSEIMLPAFRKIWRVVSTNSQNATLVKMKGLVGWQQYCFRNLQPFVTSILVNPMGIDGLCDLTRATLHWMYVCMALYERNAYKQRR